MPDPIPNTPHINQPSQTLRNPAADGGGLNPTDHGMTSRTRFLVNDYNNGNPAYWCLFMPGQNGKGGYVADPGGLPNVWPAAGSLLRVPKCVYLTSCPPAHLWGDNFVLMTQWNSSQNGYFGHFDDSKARDTRTWMPDYQPSQTVGAGSLLFDGFVGGYEYIGWTIDPQYNSREEHRRGWRKYATVHNAIVTEHTRLIAAFRDAKTYLEATYPDQVFVEITGFFPTDPVTGIAPRDQRMPKVLDVYTPDGVAANTPTHLANGPIWMLGPNFVNYDPPSKTWYTPFFGTNFLHIYCGYQADQGFLPPGESFTTYRDQQYPDITDLTDGRVNFSNSKQGYKLNLDTSFEVGETEWLSQTWDGYEVGVQGTQTLDSYNDFIDTTVALMVQSTVQNAGQDDERTVPQGKLDMLKVGWRNFAGYRVSLHEYDLTWDFGPAVTKFRSGAGITSRFPCYSLNYEDQDWVEQYAFNYATRVSQYGSGAPWHDVCYPGADGPGYPGNMGTSGQDATGNQGTPGGTDGGGGTFNPGGDYNTSSRFPGTDQYEVPGGFNDVLKAQYDNLKKAMTNAGPKTAAMWQGFITDYELDALGFQYDGGSSTVTAESIIAYVEDYYGLTPPGS